MSESSEYVDFEICHFHGKGECVGCDKHVDGDGHGQLGLFTMCPECCANAGGCVVCNQEQRDALGEKFGQDLGKIPTR